MWMSGLANICAYTMANANIGGDKMKNTKNGEMRKIHLVRKVRELFCKHKRLEIIGPRKRANYKEGTGAKVLAICKDCGKLKWVPLPHCEFQENAVWIDDYKWGKIIFEEKLDIER